MMNSVSDQSFYLGSDDDDGESSATASGDEGNESDTSSHSSSLGDRQQSKTNSYTTAWPQSYRQSIDLYSSVPSPNIGFLGPSSLSRFGSSFFSSSLHQRHTAEVTKPLLPTQADEQQHQRYSSQTLLPPHVPSRKPSMLKKAGSEHKPSKISHEFPMSRQSTYGQAVLNGMNVLCGVGILSTPYAVKEGGWLSLGILLIFAVLSFYTGLLLRYCLDNTPGMETYPDIGQAAFGKIGRFAISIILYVELYEVSILIIARGMVDLGHFQKGRLLYVMVARCDRPKDMPKTAIDMFSFVKDKACCVEYIILESDNLSSLFPNAHVTIGGLELGSHHLFALVTTLAVLPTCWLRDLSLLSYISACGVIASVLVVLSLFWVGLIDQIGFVGQGSTLNLSTLPVAIGLYGYCFPGHAIFPNIYTSMGNPNQYPAVLFTSFLICTIMCAGSAVLGYLMFGESTQSQFTLNMPKNLLASKVAVWTTVANPFTKYALTMSPVAMCLEELIPSRHLKSHTYPILIRTALVISSLLVGLTIPFFGLVMSLIGSSLTMFVTLILPCACYLSIMRHRVTYLEISACILIIIIGVVSSAFGTYSALAKIIESLI